MRSILLLLSLLSFLDSYSQFIFGADVGKAQSYTQLIQSADPRNYIKEIPYRTVTGSLYLGYTASKNVRFYLGVVQSDYGMQLDVHPYLENAYQNGFWYSMRKQFSLNLRTEVSIYKYKDFNILSSAITGVYCNYCSQKPKYILNGDVVESFYQPDPFLLVNGWESEYNNKKVFLYGLGLGLMYGINQHHFVALRADYTQGHTWNYQYKVYYKSNKTGDPAYDGAYKVYRNSSQLLAVTLGYEYHFKLKSKKD